MLRLTQSRVAGRPPLNAGPLGGNAPQRSYGDLSQSASPYPEGAVDPITRGTLYLLGIPALRQPLEKPTQFRRPLALTGHQFQLIDLASCRRAPRST